jgi:hypothetical protein
MAATFDNTDSGNSLDARRTYAIPYAKAGRAGFSYPRTAEARATEGLRKVGRLRKVG